MWFKRLTGGFFCALFFWMNCYASVSGEEVSLYSTSAVLMDADSGRVLYEKNGYSILANASTTKIMTCILVLEQGNMEDEIEVSSYAAGMPKVKLNVKKGEVYRVEDLLYSLMLESHNDSAVVLAEYIGKMHLSMEMRNKNTSEYSMEESMEAVGSFAEIMNRKAESLGCNNTFFITPNGLDAMRICREVGGNTIRQEHGTTAADLARMMAYCIRISPKREEFLEITREPVHTFTANGRTFTCVNHNAFLNMMNGVLSGKTGFTNKAGYCYVGALQEGERFFTIALLACGWPNHKTWKWSDSRKLFEYALKTFCYRNFKPRITMQPIPVSDGADMSGNPYQTAYVEPIPQRQIPVFHLLTAEGEKVVARVRLPELLDAPVKKSQKIGTVTYYLLNTAGDEELLDEIDIISPEEIAEKNYLYYAWFLIRLFCFL
ncbi:MAG: D-alanyl-D-alanine carboxypeptidase [Acetatifactor sp.]|nr:D-alanyl-D-alanine carboxypeptidase [Acetatifactor sp.]